MTRNNGYAGNILKVDLSHSKREIIPTEMYHDRFVGGRGIASRIYWDNVRPESKAFDPENMLIFMTGPATATTGFCGSRSQICGKSPLHDRFCYSNLGGSFGGRVKHAGLDGFIITGEAPTPVYLWISENEIEIRKAGHLWGKDAISTRELLKNELGKSASVLTIGTAGENKVTFATLLAENDSSASGGMGAVMGSKNLKAIALTVKGKRKIKTANPEKLAAIKEEIRHLPSASAIFNDIMSSYFHIDGVNEGLRDQICYDCIGGCFRKTFRSETGPKGKHMCQARAFYLKQSVGYHGEMNDVPFKANKLCDIYGVDTQTMEALVMWLEKCGEAGVLSDSQTGLPLSKIGSYEFIEILVKEIAHREGIGEILSLGPHKAADKLGPEAQKMITDYISKTGEKYWYNPRMYIPHGLFYAMEPRFPIQHLHEIGVINMLWGLRHMGLIEEGPTTHDMYKIARRFWGSEAAGDFTTYEGKALASAKIQDRQYAKECLILCDFRFPTLYSGKAEDPVGDPTIESQIHSAVTGRDIDEKGLYEIGERVFNLQRAILVREGHQHRSDDVPQNCDYEIPLEPDDSQFYGIVHGGENGTAGSRQGMVIDHNRFEKMKDEYYEIRKWDVASGKQTSDRLKELDLEDVSEVMKKEGFCS
jgi:aldehyde:ferredoxin oxidoreductase